MCTAQFYHFGTSQTQGQMLRAADDFRNHLVQITECLGLQRQPLPGAEFSLCTAEGF